MTKKKKGKKLKRFKQFFPYFLMSTLTILIAVFGTVDKKNAEMNIDLVTLAANDYKMSIDQLSELYVVADLSDALGFASAGDVASNYVIATTMYANGQTASGKLEKPNITNIAISRGVEEYIVQAGENVDTIAAAKGLTSDQIRWSNGLKTVNVDPGTVLYLPSQPGIVYTVKAGDTIGALAVKYRLSENEIRLFNDLETSDIYEGLKIFIKGGDAHVPENEKPEYVAPVRTFVYTYLGSTAVRQNITSLGYYYGLGGPYSAGQCTQWAWSKRPDLPGNLGNAYSWAANAAAQGYAVSWAPHGVPVAGAIFQTGGGWYGHVGYVEAVNPDGSIIISEMNYSYQIYHAIQSTVPANMVGGFNYIYPR